MRWLRALAGLASSVGLFVVARWLFRAGSPVEDVRTVTRWARSCASRLREWALDRRGALLRQYGPVSASMLSAWRQLRARYVAGAYGEEGT